MNSVPTPLLGALIGLGLGLGAVLIWRSFLDIDQTERKRLQAPSFKFTISVRRLAIGTIGAAGTFIASGWPAAAIAIGIGGYAAPAVWGSGRDLAGYGERSDAIATWIESIRDGVSAGFGLESAVRSASATAPVSIRPNLEQLVDEIDQRLPVRDALIRFGLREDHRVLDPAIATIVMALDGNATQVGEVLTEVSASSRDLAQRLAEVDASRSHSRTTTRMTLGIVVGTLILFYFGFRDMLEPYGSGTGQVGLAVFLSGIGGCLWWIHRLSLYQQPPRVVLPGLERTGDDR